MCGEGALKEDRRTARRPCQLSQSQRRVVFSIQLELKKKRKAREKEIDPYQVPKQDQVIS